MIVSPEGIEFIKSWESLHLEPYRDVKGIWTVAWGHVLREVDTKREITLEEAEAYLRKDLVGPVRSVNAVVNWWKEYGRTMKQHEFDMVVSLVYNVGAGAFYSSRTRKHLIEKEFELMTMEWMDFNKAKVRGEPYPVPVWGLQRRRMAELKTFFTGVYHYNQ